ncbi:ORF6N domain-containing protein [Parabacteroides bouchesdurhonensis]|uniref:ORF6N domain-containing protein n=1 Tax=Parabacteroides bouchesdurhonensis TaxID=1936995 RepID=UPI0030B8A6F4
MLSKDEYDSLRCNFSTSKRGSTRYMPFSFTEHGVTQLSFVLNSDIFLYLNEIYYFHIEPSNFKRCI